MDKIFLALFMLGVVVSTQLKKYYGSLSLEQIRTDARQKDKNSIRLYKVLTHKDNLFVLLLIKTAICFSVFVGILFSLTDYILASILVFVFLVALFVLLNLQISHKIGKICAIILNPMIAKELKYLHKFLSKVVKTTKYRSKTISINSKDELVELLNQTLRSNNKRQPSKKEIEIAINALNFGQKTVRETMTPRKMVTMVSANETIGPVLMGELHKSGFSRFPVYINNQDNIIGTLLIKNVLVNHDGDKVSDAIDKEVHYINEEDNLQQVLDAFIKTKHHLFIVVNNFEELTGVISIEDIIESIIGQQIVDEFDQYDNLREVALKHTKITKELEKNPVEKIVE